MVDIFGVQYAGEERYRDLCDTIKNNYELKYDWSRELYWGIKLDWEYKKKTVGLSIQGYINTVILKYHHILPKTSQNAPHKWNCTQYGVQVQMLPYED